MHEWLAKRRDIRSARRGLKKLKRLGYIIAVDPAAGPDMCVVTSIVDGKIAGMRFEPRYIDFTKQYPTKKGE